jgi:hypothetical protein
MHWDLTRPHSESRTLTPHHPRRRQTTYKDIHPLSLSPSLSLPSLSLSLPPSPSLSLSESSQTFSHCISHFFGRHIHAENVLYNAVTGDVHLIDFSEARVFRTQSRLSDRMTGTPAYSSPEQSGRLNRPVDFRSDLYNLGVTFYWMLTGSLPFKQHRANLLNLVHAHISADVPNIRSVRCDVPLEVACAVEKLLQQDPDDRFQSACGLWKQLVTIRDSLRDRASRGREEVEREERERDREREGGSCSCLDTQLVKLAQMLRIGRE